MKTACTSPSSRGWTISIYCTVLAPSPATATQMPRETCMACRPAGLHLQPLRCKWSSNGDCDETITVQGQTLERVDPRIGLEVLGAIVQFRGGSAPQHEARLAESWRAFWANSALLLNRCVGFYQGLRLLHTAVTPTMVWAVGGLTHTRRMVQPFNATMKAMAARIGGCKHRMAEPWLTWFRRG